jgi:glyoxylase-like metal-dependent hydrolase (beta-lactamase superfamily II)
VQVTKFSVGPYDNNVYVVAADGRAFVVDGAAEPERILAEVRRLEVIGIVQTHNHSDHIHALRGLTEALPATVYAHPFDPPPVAFEPIGEGFSLPLGDVNLEVLHTPGHTPGSLTFRVEDLLFTGDTLFPGGPGNTSRDPGHFARIMESLDRLFEYPDDTRVCPGHGLDTTIGRERPYLEIWRERGW